MSEEIEIEFKTLITRNEFSRLCEKYAKDSKPLSQTNYYFDTPDGQLYRQKMGLRIRLFDTHAEQTLKTSQGAAHSLLETTDSLSISTAQELIACDKIMKNGKVTQKLEEKEISMSRLKIIGQVRTTRYKIALAIGEIALDYSEFATKNDYELELEVQNKQLGYLAFKDFLQENKIHEQKTLNKVARMLQYQK